MHIYIFTHTHTHKTTSLRDFLNKAKEEKSEQISTHLPLHICKYYLKNQNIGSIIVLLLRKILKREGKRNYLEIGQIRSLECLRTIALEAINI